MKPTPPQTQALRIPMRPDGADAFVAFARGLAADPSALGAVLREEGMLAEVLLLDRGPSGPSVILFTKAVDLAAAHAAYAASSHPIQQRMRALATEAFDLEGATQLDVLLDLTGAFEGTGAAGG